MFLINSTLNHLKNIFFKQETDDIFSLYQAYIKSIYFCINGIELNQHLRFVDKSVENAEFAVHLKEYIQKQNSYILFRNPYSNLVSIRKFISRGKKKIPFLRTAILGMYNSFYHLYNNQKLIDNYKVVKYEDLLNSPKENLLELCSFLNIHFEKCLEIPTHLGEIWSGNSTRNRKFTNISNKNINSWESDITNLEIFIINKYFKYFLSEYNYSQVDKKYSFFYKERK